jgi:hypothetical protein
VSDHLDQEGDKWNIGRRCLNFLTRKQVNFTFGFAAQFDGTSFGSHDVISAAVSGLDLWRDNHSQVGHLYKDVSDLDASEL